MNLQLDQLLSVPSKREEQLFDEITDLFIGAQHAAMMIQQQIASAELLCAVYDHVRKYGITEENRDLFAMSFESVGCDYSEENILANAYHSVKNVIERIIKFLKEKVQVFFKKLKDWFNGIFRKKLQDASKEPLPKEKEAEFNKRMTSGGSKSSTEGVKDASFKDIADELDLIDGDKIVPVDVLVKGLGALVTFLKEISSNITNGKYQQPEFPSPSRPLTTPSQGGWADPNKLLKIIDGTNQVSDAIDDLIVDVGRAGQSLEKSDMENKNDAMDFLKNLGKNVQQLLMEIRLIVITAKKAMMIREDLMKDKIPD